MNCSKLCGSNHFNEHHPLVLFSSSQFDWIRWNGFPHFGPFCSFSILVCTSETEREGECGSGSDCIEGLLAIKIEQSERIRTFSSDWWSTETERNWIISDIHVFRVAMTHALPFWYLVRCIWRMPSCYNCHMHTAIINCSISSPHQSQPHRDFVCFTFLFIRSTLFFHAISIQTNVNGFNPWYYAMCECVCACVHVDMWQSKLKSSSSALVSSHDALYADIYLYFEDFCFFSLFFVGFGLHVIQEMAIKYWWQ